MDTMYKTAPPIEETELAFCKRKMQDRASYIAELEGRNTNLRVALDAISEILEEVFA